MVFEAGRARTAGGSRRPPGRAGRCRRPRSRGRGVAARAVELDLAEERAVQRRAELLEALHLDAVDAHEHDAVPSGAGGTGAGTPSLAVTCSSGRSRAAAARRRALEQEPAAERPAAARKWQRIARIAAGDSKAGLRLSNVIVASRRITSGPSGSRARRRRCACRGRGVGGVALEHRQRMPAQALRPHERRCRSARRGRCGRRPPSRSARRTARTPPRGAGGGDRGVVSLPSASSARLVGEVRARVTGATRLARRPAPRRQRDREQRAEQPAPSGAGAAPSRRRRGRRAARRRRCSRAPGRGGRSRP